MLSAPVGAVEVCDCSVPIPVAGKTYLSRIPYYWDWAQSIWVHGPLNPKS